MKRKLMVCLVVAIVGFGGSGCSYIANYAGNRGADFVDIWRAEATVGPGLDAHVQVTSLLGTAFGYSKQYGAMLHGRYTGLGSRDSGGIIVMGSTKVDHDFMIPVYGRGDYDPPSRSWIAFLRWPPFRPALRPREWPRLLDIEVGASALVGLHFGFSPIELVDFLIGWTTIDICGDDNHPYYKAEHLPPLPEIPPVEGACLVREETDY